MPDKPLKIMFWNARGITSKLTEFKNFIIRQDIDVICVCETFLKTKHSISFNGYDQIRKDRENARLGGLLIFVKNYILIKQFNCPDTNLLECLGIEITLTNQSKLIIINAYLPGGANDNTIRDHYNNDLTALTSTPNAYLIMGDLNSRHPNWNCVDANTAGNILKHAADMNNFFIEFPSDHTYCPVTLFKSQSTMDIVLTNNKVSISELETQNIFDSDHLPVTLSVHADVIKSTVSRFNYRFANWNRFRYTLEQLAGDLITADINSPSAIDSCINELTTAIQESMKKAIPIQRFGPDRLLINDNLRLIINYRNYYRKRFLRYHNIIDKEKFNHFANLVKYEIRELQRERWEKKLNHCETDKDELYKIAKTLKAKSSLIPPLKLSNGTILTDNNSKANALADRFVLNHTNPLESKHKIHTKHVLTTVDTYLAQDTEVPVPLKYEEVADCIKKLKSNKSPGVDKIPNKVIKNLPNTIIFFLTVIYNKCLQYNYFPKSWKEAIVVPIKKPGDPKLIANYRPISLLIGLSKIFERLILNRLNDFVEERGLIPDVQFGFRTKHSTSLQLLRLYRFVKSGLAAKKSTGMLAIDVEKAFDRVWHKGLLFKLIKKEVPGYLIKILNSFLSNRIFKVRVGLSLSSNRSIRYGVPQGGVLSPVLYNVYTSDIPELEDCELALFADDTAIFTSSRFYKTIKKRLTKATHTLFRYFLKWKITINSGKTGAIFFTRRKAKQLPGRDLLKLGGQTIRWESTIKYLGLHLDPKFNFHKHIDFCLNKADNSIKMLYPLLNRRSVLSKKIKNLIYKVCIRPILLYPGILVGQVSKTKIKKLQIKQNKILRLLNSRRYDYKTSKLHEEAKVEFVKEFITKLYERASLRSLESENPLIAELFSEDVS